MSHRTVLALSPASFASVIAISGADDLAWLNPHDEFRFVCNLTVYVLKVSWTGGVGGEAMQLLSGTLALTWVWGPSPGPHSLTFCRRG